MRWICSWFASPVSREVDRRSVHRSGSERKLDLRRRFDGTWCKRAPADGGRNITDVDAVKAFPGNSCPRSLTRGWVPILRQEMRQNMESGALSAHQRCTIQANVIGKRS